MVLDGSTSSPRTDEDKANAIQLLDESLAISTELGMRPLTERVLSRREDTEGVEAALLYG